MIGWLKISHMIRQSDADLFASGQRFVARSLLHSLILIRAYILMYWYDGVGKAISCFKHVGHMKQLPRTRAR